MKNMSHLSSCACARTHAQENCVPIEELEKQIEFAVKLIRKAAAQHDYTIAFSGGKDSVVLAHLAKLAGVTMPLVYNSTTIDPPGTIAFVEKSGASIIRPKRTFLQLIEAKGLPTMFKRFCCAELKEQFISPFLMVGIRKAESVKRNKRYCDFELERTYPKSNVTMQLLPMLHFTDETIDYIVKRDSLQCHPLYYDADGQFHVERRLGCIGCPLKSDRGRQDFRNCPKLLRQIAIRLIRFHISHGRTKEDAYRQLVYQLFYSNHGHTKYVNRFEGLFPDDPKRVLEDYFNIELP